jgi:hypothetical protein
MPRVNLLTCFLSVAVIVVYGIFTAEWYPAANEKGTGLLKTYALLWGTAFIAYVLIGGIIRF